MQLQTIKLQQKYNYFLIPMEEISLNIASLCLQVTLMVIKNAL